MTTLRAVGVGLVVAGILSLAIPRKPGVQRLWWLAASGALAGLSAGFLIPSASVGIRVLASLGGAFGVAVLFVLLPYWIKLQTQWPWREDDPPAHDE